MTLEELIEIYQLESYEFYVDKDKDGMIVKRYFIFDNHQDYLDKYLGFYKNLGELTEVIIYATNGFFKVTQLGVDFFIRHGHQAEFKDKAGNLRGINPSILNEVKQNLIMNIDALKAVQDFKQLIDIVKDAKVRGFGELAIYDTSIRIGSFLDVLPTEVFLHAGTRIGCRELEQKGYIEIGSSESLSIALSKLPVVLQQFQSLYLEHFFCAAKDKFKMLDDHSN